ncbi:hypothetical protein HG536_0F04270 [Torulaspora globosa]|uniref:Tubulin-folding cofactor D ARM repeats domain-containing protein n=1 Tax=Torulaspora globosa TaxID=48254 RepID=A0A7G3ZKR5_9SACH|nr:uncharacterized protein HG536_0F04270 [Torulaspora globosa]QLL34101.1 hypothetical protein HG536_0F04270 [Torulaspora globosa]
MYDEPVDVLLRQIDYGIESISAVSVESLLKRIDAFQQDPSKLESDGRLSRYVKTVVRDFFVLDREAQLRRCRIFYNLCKVVKWKKVVVNLPTNVFLLSGLLAELKKKDGGWFRPYLLLSWVYILTLSPFKFNEFYDEIHAAMDSYRGLQILKTIIAHIHSQLLLKNVELLDKEIQELDPLTLNYLLKTLKPNDPVINESVLIQLNSIDLKDDELTTLKVLPKLFRINIAHENWEAAEDIISFYFSHLNSRFTDYRFALAHSFFKVLSALIEDTEDTDTALELIETCINQIRVSFRETAAALVDHDLLHTNLLIIAEMSRVISVSWPHLLEVIAEEIIPFASKFEQVKMNEIKGSQVKDASNYICWSLARSTRLPRVKLSRDVMRTIFLNLLMCSVFDRDLVVRRSANAALQEVLGRCLASSKMLDNETVIKLIELPILNLVESYTENTSRIYQIFTRKQIYEPYVHFLLDWLIEACLVETNDLHIVKLMVQALSLLLKNNPSATPIIKPKLEKLIASTPSNEPYIASRVLLLLVTLETEKILTTHNMNVIPEMKNYYQNSLESVKIEQKIHESDHEEHFKFMVILRYWNFALKRKPELILDRTGISVCFHIVRMIPERSSELKLLFGDLIASLSKSSKNFAQPEDEALFWASFEKFIRFNNSVVCSAVPRLPPHRFQVIFNNLLSVMDCQRKADLLRTLNDNLPQLIDVTEAKILQTVVQLLNDYTVTQQGDVGRLVRIGAAKIIARHRDLFMNSKASNVASDAIANLLRLSGEQVTDLRLICFSTLCKAFDYETKLSDKDLNYRLLEFNHRFFRSECIDFWKGFMITGGAIHFTDSQVVDAIDAFLHYYNQLPTNQERLALCNSLVRIIPSAKQINEVRNSPSRKLWGMMEQDIVKLTVNYLNFWKRLFESGLVLDREFNFFGFYAKIHNLNLINGNSLLKSLTTQLLPYLISSQTAATGQIDKIFTNNIISRLLSLAQREIPFKKRELSGIQKDSLQALAQIYLESESFERLEVLMQASLTNDSILGLSEAQLTL